MIIFLGTVMHYDKIEKLAMLFEKKAQTVEVIDPAAVIQKTDFEKELYDALVESANAGVVSQGETFDLGIKVGPNNKAIVDVSPSNPALQSNLNKYVGRKVSDILNSNGIDGSGYIWNGFRRDWGWI